MQHAFVVLGDETTFLVHMTNMWMEPHVYQCILRVQLPDATKRTLAADRTEHPDAWHLVGNQETDKLVLPDLARRAKTSFRGAIWRGFPDPNKPGTPHWPWANTPPIADGFEVEVELVVHYRRFDFNLERPKSLTYVLFGKGNEAHLQNYQIRQPDFDHMVTLAARPAWLAPELLETGVHVNFPDLPPMPRAREARSESAPDNDVYCEPPFGLGSHGVQLSGHGVPRPITVDRHVFFETFPVNQQDPCPPRTERGARGVASAGSKGH